MDDAAIAGTPSATDDEDAGRPGSATTRAIARAGILVTVLFLLSRVLGYVRTIAIAGSARATSSPDTMRRPAASSFALCQRLPLCAPSNTKCGSPASRPLKARHAFPVRAPS